MLATKNTCLLFMIRNLERVVFIESSQICGGVAQRFALPALGRAAGRRPIGKMLRRRKMLGIAPESPASGARFVGLRHLELRFFEEYFFLSGMPCFA
jgi:hypothetical protein